MAPDSQRKRRIGDYELPSWCGFPKTKPKWLWMEVCKAGRSRVGIFSLLKKSVNIVGRDKRADLPLKHLSLSRQHAAFLHHSGEGVGLFIVDLGSRHGTFVGEKRIDPKTPVRLTPGVKVRFGASTRHFVLRTTNPKTSSRPRARAAPGPSALPPTTPVESQAKDAQSDKMGAENDGKDAPGDGQAAGVSSTEETSASGRAAHVDTAAQIMKIPFDPNSTKGKFEGLEIVEEGDGGEGKWGGEESEKGKADEEAKRKQRRILLLKQKAAMKRKRSLIPKSRSLTSLYGTLPREEVLDDQSKVLARLKKEGDVEKKEDKNSENDGEAKNSKKQRVEEIRAE